MAGCGCSGRLRRTRRYNDKRPARFAPHAPVAMLLAGIEVDRISLRQCGFLVADVEPQFALGDAYELCTGVSVQSSYASSATERNSAR